jgi:hypothetical protein
MPNTLNNATLTSLSTAAIAALYQNVATLPTLQRVPGPADRGIGDTVKVRVGATVSASNFAGTANAQDLVEKSVDVKIDQQPNSQITLTAKELTFGIQELAQVIAPQMNGLAEFVDTYLNTKIVAAAPAAAVGAALTKASEVFAVGRKTLNDNKVPMGDRFAVLTAADAQKLLGISGILDASQSNDGGTAWREAQLGRKFGFQVYESQFATASAMYHSSCVPVAFGTPVQPLGGAVVGSAEWDGIVSQLIFGWDNGSLSNKATAHLLFGAKENLDGGGAGTGKRAIKLSFAAVTAA